MAIEVTMPKFGLTMQEGTVQRYFKSPGDAVAAGEPLYEVETEKVLYQVEAPAAGTLAIVLAAEGETVECGARVAVIAEPGEDLAAIVARYRIESKPVRPAAGAAQPAREPAGAAAAPRPSSALGAGGRRAVSPIARKLAAELGVDVDAIEGSGPGGRVTREDVERAASASAAAKPAAPISAPATGVSGERIALRGVRKLIAERMHQSLRDTAQITITTEADAAPAVERRERLRARFDLTYTDMIVYAVSRALLKHPRMNSQLKGGEIIVPDTVGVGIAVALEDGLIVPVVHDAARKRLDQIALEARELGERARAGALKLEDVTGATFTVTNLGTYGIDAFTPILNPGETGILGVGRIIEKPVVRGGEIVPRAMITLSLTFDHRVIDGAPAAEFLRSLIELFNSAES
ncbi:MAG TPA: dihydrolipoamide acetyltransferase family protein [Candidatus Binataceae bacterium]|nr:dihydrolipoamide acetyltransferase family protein [Candidatus Binataceae bacterium]